MQDSAVNKALVEKLLEIENSLEWKLISTADDVNISLMTLSPDFEVAGRVIGDEAKFAMVKCECVLEAPPGQVYEFFTSNRRVKEYNEYCTQVQDIEYLDTQTKISWSCSGQIAGGLVQARDFVTRSQYCALDDGTLVIVNRAEEHPRALPTDAYVRMKLVWGGNLLRASGGQTILKTFTHINPGGVGESRVGSLFLNSLAAAGPRKFVKGLRSCIEADRRRDSTDSLDSSHSTSSTCGHSSASTEDAEERVSPREDDEQGSATSTKAAFSFLSLSPPVWLSAWGQDMQEGVFRGWTKGGADEKQCGLCGKPEGRHVETEEETKFVNELQMRVQSWQR